MKVSKQGCGRSQGYGHGDYAVCGEPYCGGTYICYDCKLNKMVKSSNVYRKMCVELLAAAKNYLPYMPTNTVEDNKHSGMIRASDKLKSVINKVEETLNEEH